MKNSFISSFEKSVKYKVKMLHVFLFVLLFISSLIPLELVNRSFISNQSIDFITLRAFDREKEFIEVLFLGDSHFQLGIDTRLFDFETFDLSSGGANYIQYYYVLKHYIDEMESLKYVVIPVDLSSFSSYTTDTVPDRMLWNKFIDYHELSKMKGLRILKNRVYITLLQEDVGRGNFVSNLKDFVLERLGFGNPKPVHSPPDETQRLMVLDSMFQSRQVIDRDRIFRRVRRHFQGQHTFDGDLLIYFDKILALCRENNIPVITMQMPMSKDYVEYSEEYITEDEIMSEILENPKYSNRIYRDFNYLRVYLDKDEFFMDDGDHLNVKGRESFSELLSHEMAERLPLLYNRVTARWKPS